MKLKDFVVAGAIAFLLAYCSQVIGEPKQSEVQQTATLTVAK